MAEPARPLDPAVAAMQGRLAANRGRGGTITPYPRTSELPEVPSFPVEVFPPPLRRYLEQAAEAGGFPVDMAALPTLAFAAGAIGNTRALVVKPGWVVRAIVWLAVVGRPGTGKSPALDYARRLIDQLQKGAWDAFQVALAEWEEAAAAAKAQKPPGEPPPKPTLEHFFTTDATMEALADMLAASPGLTVLRDELVGWIKSHDAYRKAGDRQNWLSLWAGSPLKVDRRGSGSRYVERPTASVFGGIQPDLIPEMAEEAGRADGFFDRFLVAYPDAPSSRWTEASVAPEVEAAAREVFGRLRRESGEASFVPLSPEARAVFSRWYDENADLGDEASGLASGCYAKYPGQCAAFALILHCLHHPTDPARPVDAGTVRDAIALIEYFRGHLLRVLPALGATGSARTVGVAARVERVLDRAREEDGEGWVSRTAISKGLGGRTPAAEIAAALQALEAEGKAESRTVQTGKHPREDWRRVVAEVWRYEQMAPREAISPYLHTSARDDEEGVWTR